ncbi:Hemin import ATP-binding protein HmuV [Pseudogemmobacter humi]|uniref:Hemin import ATP-binding protein HmuV n=1 Tax=Pseudogemmobacter humi TaxID=2483812 RepID=A0A3P5XTA7_9RHOB|nr:Hemin import ATP-binding protein HmuV [Pseudogemmobacter humi]
MVWPVAVEDLVALGWRAHPDHHGEGLAEARAWLARLGLQDFARRQVPGLSGGEKARVLMARALAQGAPLLIADEPCAALDPAQAIRTARLLRAEAGAGRAVLATLHDLPLAARHCTRIVMMHHGRILADGPPADVLREDLMAQVFGIALDRRPGPGGDHWLITELTENEDA